MLENLKRQEAVLPTIDRSQTLEMLLQLQTLYFGDNEALMKYGDAAYWNELAKGQMSCCLSSLPSSSSCADEVIARPGHNDADVSLPRLNSNFLDHITSHGYHVLQPPARPGEETQNKYSSSAFTNTLKALGDAGWPPQFLLLYDETWELLRDTVHQIMGGSGSNGDNVTIESDVNIWSLHKNSPPGSYIGGNFINPHRDMAFDACHNDDEHPTSLSVWIPLNPSGATEFNGCMRCIPIESDDFFYSPQHPRHSTNSQYTDDDAEKLIVQQFGCGVWDPSVVHWGGSYESDRCQEDARSSLAFTIRLGSKAANFGTAASVISAGNSTLLLEQADQSGPTACLVRECERGGLRRRIQVVAKSLLSYSHHWPGFPYKGFRENLKQSKLVIAEESHSHLNSN